MSGDLDVNCFVRLMFLLLFFFEELLISISTENCSAVPSANNHSSLILENQPRFIFILRSFSAKDVCVCVFPGLLLLPSLTITMEKQPFEAVSI